MGGNCENFQFKLIAKIKFVILKYNTFSFLLNSANTKITIEIKIIKVIKVIKT